MIYHDFHTHTCYSSDSTATVREEIESAIEKGLKGICITDHMDLDFPCIERSGMPFVFDVDKYFEELSSPREEYKDRIKVYIGMETGLRNETDLVAKMQKGYADFAAKYPFDFLIGSIHCLEHTDPAYASPYWDDKTAIEGIRTFFEASLFGINNYNDFDTFGHLDYIVRYVPTMDSWHGTNDYNPADYMDIIEEFLKAVIAKNKALEINSAGLKYGIGFAHPKAEILKRYRELGGEMITIGSDGHKPCHIAYDFDKVGDMLKAAGFKYYTIFEQRKPQFVNL